MLTQIDLEQQIDTYSAKVSTTSYSMSVGELVSMYKDGELNLHPEFQRFFRWTVEQKSKFIESLLLGIPIPPIFVSERSNSYWDVIDGLQRISTIFEVMGELRDEEKQLKEQLALTRTRYLPSLEGKLWQSDVEENQLPESAKVRIKRSRIDVNIVKKTSDEIAKYEIFQRLNTGGSVATNQEVRNCILVMNNRDFFYRIKGLAELESFKECVLITDRALEESFDLELLTRFFVFCSSNQTKLSQINELGDFLTDEILEISKINQNGDLNQRIESAFQETFRYLAEHFGANSFRKFNLDQDRYYGGTLVSLFEVVAVGIGRNLLAGRTLPNPVIFCERHKNLGSDNYVKQFTRSGIRSSYRIPKTIEFGENLVQSCLS
ncbi:MAG: DUF262 domain-containing protein [Spirulina sp.]